MRPDANATTTPLGFGLGRHLRNVGRLTQIAQVFARHGFGSILERIKIGSLLNAEDAKRLQEQHSETMGQVASSTIGLPIRLRQALEELGPTFVKLGQLLAVREDLVPKPFIEELRKLHSSVSSLPYPVISRIIAEELGAERLALIAEIDVEPLAAGSIGQVHAARLASGEEVVIKVQRPQIEQQVKIDLSLMELLAGILEKYIPELEFLRPRLTVSEFSRSILAELDFVREAANANKFTENFADIPHVTIPKVFWELTTARVVVYSRLPGSPVTNRAVMEQQGLHVKTLLERSVAMFLKMVFIDGVYHGDLHPGNIFALEGNAIGLIDFGVTVRLGRAAQQSLAGLLTSLLDERYDDLVAHFLELAEPDADFDISAFTHEITNAIGPFVGLKVADKRTGKLLWELAAIAAHHGAPMPRELILFFRTVASLEGMAGQLDPYFDLVGECRKYTQDIVAKMYAPENMLTDATILFRDVVHLMRFAPQQMRRILKALQQGQLTLNVNIEDITKLASAVDKASARLSVSLVLGAFFIGSSILLYAHVEVLKWNTSLIGIGGFCLAGVLGIYLIISLFRGNIK